MNNVVRISSLAEFAAEVPEGMVRLCFTERAIGSTIPTKAIDLHLQGFNDLEELVWLMESHEVTWIGDGPASPRDRSIYQVMNELKSIVYDHLKDHGYEIRTGLYGMPHDIRPLRGHFEIVRWQKTDDTWSITPLNHDEPADE